jgi:hypothetical protein
MLCCQARLRLGSEGNCIEAWQLYVDQYRGDERYTAAQLVAAAEALFSERCVGSTSLTSR